MPMLSPVKIDESAELVMSATRADSLAMADFRYKSAIESTSPLSKQCHKLGDGLPERDGCLRDGRLAFTPCAKAAPVTYRMNGIPLNYLCSGCTTPASRFHWSI